MRTPKSFLDAFIGKSSDDLIQVKDAEETLTREEFEEMARVAAEQKSQIQVEYTKQMAQRDAALAAAQAQQQAQWVPPGTLGSPGPSLPPPPTQTWPPGGMISVQPGGTSPTPPTAGIIERLFGDGASENVQMSKAEFDERLKESWHDGYEEGYDDAETYCMEKDEEDEFGNSQWGTFADAVKAVGINPLTSGKLGVHNGASLFSSKGAKGDVSLEGNEETFTLATIDKAVEAAKAVTPGQGSRSWQAVPGGELGFKGGLVTHNRAAQLEENARRSQEVHEMLGASGLPVRGWANGVDGPLSPSVGDWTGHSEESEGELLREGFYEEAQEVAEAETEGRETDE